jgi:hypothetical protein
VRLSFRIVEAEAILDEREGLVNEEKTQLAKYDVCRMIKTSFLCRRS